MVHGAAAPQQQQSAAGPARKLFYMHVAKTGGTSFNAALERLFPAGSAYVHIENRLHADAAAVAPLHDARFISGHVTYPLYLRFFGADRHFRLATLRRPMPHLWSHLNWVRHLTDPGQEAFLAGHPDWVRDSSLKIRATDFHDAASVEAFVASLTPPERSLFDNCQTRYFAGGAEAHGGDRRPWLAQALRHLEAFELVGLTEQLDDTYALLCIRLGIDIPDSGFPRLNRASNAGSHEDLPADALQRLAPLIRQDYELYVAGQQRFAAQLANAGAGVEAARLHVDRSDALVAGWCAGADGRPAWLKLVFDQGTAVYVQARLPRPDVKAAGLHPSGHCGFRYELPAALQGARRVEVYALGGAQPLAVRELAP